MPKRSSPGTKYKKIMEEYKEGTLHSGSKKGPKVKNLAQARAIGFSEQRIADKTAKGMKNARGMPKKKACKK